MNSMFCFDVFLFFKQDCKYRMINGILVMAS